MLDKIIGKKLLSLSIYITLMNIIHHDYNNSGFVISDLMVKGKYGAKL
jgi:hypothetical protein